MGPAGQEETGRVQKQTSGFRRLNGIQPSSAQYCRVKPGGIAVVSSAPTMASASTVPEGPRWSVSPVNRVLPSKTGGMAQKARFQVWMLTRQGCFAASLE